MKKWHKWLGFYVFATVTVWSLLVAYELLGNYRSQIWQQVVNTNVSEVQFDNLLTKDSAQLWLAELRANYDVPLLEQSDSLERVARLVAVDLVDRQSLEGSDVASEWLDLLGTTAPEQLQTLAFFWPNEVDNQLWENAIATPESVLQSDLRLVGIATRSATFQKTNGVLAVWLLSPALPKLEVAPTLIPIDSQPLEPAAYPTYTGAELWEAVQLYRRAHDLPEFQQANELCTVASIRLNELLELGKLDNHDGFRPRADQFFIDHPGWNHINENLAQGYQTAVATVEWGWDQSLGHRALIQSRDHPYACTAANRGFAVLITGGH